MTKIQGRNENLLENNAKYQSVISSKAFGAKRNRVYSSLNNNQFVYIYFFQVQRKWNIRPDSGTRNVSVVTSARHQSVQSLSSQGNKKFIVLGVTKKNTQQGVLSVIRLVVFFFQGYIYY